MKKLIAMLLVLVMVVALGTTAFADDAKVGETVLKCAFNQTITNPEAQTLLKISDDLYDATEGRYSLEVYPDASLGDQAQTLENVMIGALDMSLVGNAIIEPYSSDFSIIATPYIYDSIEHQEKVFESDADALKALYATTEEHGFTVLCTYSLGARNLYTRDGPVTNPDELKGLKIRVMGSDTCLNMMNAMGGVGVAMAQGDVYSAIQTKTLDGAENNIITYVDLVQYEVAPYYNYSGHLLLPDELVISNEVLESMSEEDQAALRKV
ncbi:MAG: TRAP transporter substrate-binding protein DctP, partial [Oscillospiraceae bacterium]|nr:TRAP transporter substrate-binding protein DctP [Oscillospiraceae bacterium]